MSKFLVIFFGAYNISWPSSIFLKTIQTNHNEGLCVGE